MGRSNQESMSPGLEEKNGQTSSISKVHLGAKSFRRIKQVAGKGNSPPQNRKGKLGEKRKDEGKDSEKWSQEIKTDVTVWCEAMGERRLRRKLVLSHPIGKRRDKEEKGV